jgi:hypothetical protein
MLAEARASTLRQDADLASEYAHIRHVWQANVEFLMYLDEHAAHARYVNNQLLFDDPAEAEAMQVLLRRLAIFRRKNDSVKLAAAPTDKHGR